MHNFLCSTVIALLGACTLPALAETDTANVQRIKITGPHGAVAAAQAVLAPRGEDTHCEMSNGRKVVVTA